MAGINLIAYSLSKSYTDETADQFGGLKGANCTIKSITKSDGVNTIIFEWKNDQGETRESTLTVNDGTPIYAWTSGDSYQINDLVIYASSFYRCTVANSDVTFDDTKWDAINSADGNYDIVQNSSMLPSIFTQDDRKMYYSIADSAFYLWNGTAWVKQQMGDANVQSDWNQVDTEADDYIKNKPENLVQDSNYVHTDNNFDNTTKNKIDNLGTAASLNVAESGNAGNNEVVKGDDTRLSDSRPASDVSAWAKASTKPEYSYSEITGTPTLGTAAALNVAISGNAGSDEVVKGDDTRLTDDRNAADVYSWAKAETKPSYDYSEIENKPTLGSASALDVAESGNAGVNEVVIGDDTRLTDARTPIAHNHTVSDITDFPTLGTASALNVAESGNASTTEVVKGDDTRLTNSRPASDVSAWAKEATKPSYAYSEITGTPTLGTAAGLDVATSGNASSSQVVKGDDTRLTDARNAADVYNWAKAETKPSYTATEVGAIASTLKGVANGVAELDANGLVPSSQLPSYVDDVIEVADYSSLPITGESGKIYVTKDTNKTYRWSGSGYTEISPSLALGEISSTAYRGDRGKTAYDHATDSSRLTTATTSGLYKVASTAEGHIASLIAVQKSDITALGIPESDTDTKVTQTATTTDANYEVLFSATADNTTRTEGAGKSTGLRFNPSTGSLMEGSSTVASGQYSHAEGSETSASGDYSHAEGYMTTASIDYSHAEGVASIASGMISHAEGSGSTASGMMAHAEGCGTCATGSSSHAECDNTKAIGNQSHAEGYRTTASGNYSHAGGYYTCASGNGAHAEGGYSTNTYIGKGTYATNDNAHAEGLNTTASGKYSHAEGSLTNATSFNTHAEGGNTIASGLTSHAEGSYSSATGDGAHAEGGYAESGYKGTLASGANSHAEGYLTTASGNYSHAAGQGTCAAGIAQTVVGKYNMSDTTSLFIVGNGTGTGGPTNRNNALAVSSDGTTTLGASGSIASGNSQAVTGGAVYTAIQNALSIFGIAENESF